MAVSASIDRALAAFRWRTAAPLYATPWPRRMSPCAVEPGKSTSPWAQARSTHVRPRTATPRATAKLLITCIGCSFAGAFGKGQVRMERNIGHSFRSVNLAELGGGRGRAAPCLLGDERHRHLPDDEAAAQGGGAAGPVLAPLVPRGDGHRLAGTERAAGGPAAFGRARRPSHDPAV